ncbi:MAG: hypothetical protein H7A53_06060 [Akkermansiaceae bacterium]|nr:hypothetical protein [Akkermansiaceae bacterium]
MDSTSHEIVPLTNVGANRAEIIDRVRRIESMGGGIFVYTGLKAAWEQLRKAEIGQRHHPFHRRGGFRRNRGITSGWWTRS